MEACHRLKSRKTPAPTIVRTRRNIIDSVRKNKKNLKDIAARLNLSQGTRLFFNENLSPAMKNVDYNARKLEKEEMVASSWFNNASVRVKCHNGRVLLANHDIDLYEAFPNFQGFTFDTQLYDRVLNRDLEELEYVHYIDGNNDILQPTGDQVSTL